MLALWSLIYTATANDVQHQFVCIGNHRDVLVYVDQVTPEQSWETKIPKGSRDIQLISPDILLVSHGSGASEYRLSDGKQLDWVVTGYKGVQSARRLDNGHTLLLTSKGRIITLDENKEEVSSVQIKKKPLDLRLVRFSSEGNLIIGAKKPKAVLEINLQGSVLKQIDLPGKGYTATKEENGTYLSSTGDECKVVEINADGEIVRYVGGKQDHPDLKLDFNSGWDRTENGHVIMTNWLGHKKHNTASHLIEFNEKNEVVWQWADHDLVKQVTNLLIIK